MITAVDWGLDATALLVSVVIASKLSTITVKQLLIILASLSVYALHEAWEARLVGGITHVRFEQYLVEVLA